MPQAIDPVVLFDLTRHPIDDLDGAQGRALVARCRDELAASGASELSDFLLPDATARLAAVCRPKVRSPETENYEVIDAV